MALDPEKLAEKSLAWDWATEKVTPIVEQHGLEPYRVGGGFASPGSMFTSVEQHLGEIMRVADWLLGKEG